jgi:hypothetical protein
MSAINFGVAGTGNGDLGKAIVVIVGLLTITNAGFNGFVICNHPQFRAAKRQQGLTDEVSAHPCRQ